MTRSIFKAVWKRGDEHGRLPLAATSRQRIITKKAVPCLSAVEFRTMLLATIAGERCKRTESDYRLGTTAVGLR